MSADTWSQPLPAGIGPAWPTLADLDAATDATQAAIDNPAAATADVYRAAEAEMAAFIAFEHSPAEREAWGGREPSATYAEWAAEGRPETEPEITP